MNKLFLLKSFFFYTSLFFSDFYNNNLCPPYPDCLTNNHIGEQNIEDCDEYTVECEDGYGETYGFCLYQSDLDVLQQLIDNSQGGENPPPSNLPPFYLGEQVWNDGRITSLVCVNEGLAGSIPSDIGSLTYLYQLNLGGNQLSGSIPPEIESLTNLDFLYLNNSS